MTRTRVALLRSASGGHRSEEQLVGVVELTMTRVLQEKQSFIMEGPR
jgi:hypothetical protein